MITKNGSLLIFRLFGIGVYVNFTWVLVAVLYLQGQLNLFGLARVGNHGTAYHAAWLLCLFGIVLMHEFGHALACKSVGGRVDSIVLHPLGGAAFVRPPDRPAPFLWSIVAGPLVNVLLLPLLYLARHAASGPDAVDFTRDLYQTNLLLLIFNMLPFYPLDGGQIFRCLVWFVLGKSLSYFIAGGVGVLGAALFALLLFLGGGTLLAPLLVAYMGFLSIQAIRIGVIVWRQEHSPRHFSAQCPRCHAAPPIGPHWMCPCGTRFETFDTGGRCPACGRTFDMTSCPFCGTNSPLTLWTAAPGTVPPPPQAVAANPYAVPFPRSNA